MNKTNIEKLFKDNETSVLLHQDVIFADRFDYWHATGKIENPVLWLIHPATNTFYKALTKTPNKWLSKFNSDVGLLAAPKILQHLARQDPQFLYLIAPRNLQDLAENTLAKFMQRCATPRNLTAQRDPTMWATFCLHNKESDIRWYLTGPSGATLKKLISKHHNTMMRLTRDAPKYFTEQHCNVVKRLLNGDLKFTTDNTEVTLLRRVSSREIDSVIKIDLARKNTAQLCTLAGGARYVNAVDLNVHTRPSLARPQFKLN